MIIRKKYLRKIENYLGFLDAGSEVILAFPVTQDQIPNVKEAGFKFPLTVGDSVLPADSFGPVSDRNANGWVEVHKDQAMETAYRQIEWHWVEWHGQDRVDQWKVVDVPYKRYPRTRHDPPSVELTVAEDSNGRTLLVTPKYQYQPAHYAQILHATNLLLEIFGECHLLSDDLEELVRPISRRLNWDILPPGEYPWERVKQWLTPTIEREPPGTQKVLWRRFRVIEEYGPKFRASGVAGFRGYLIFGFQERGIFILENAHYGNATYVLGEDWEVLSQLSKAEVIHSGRLDKRVVHREGWEAQIRRILTEQS